LNPDAYIDHFERKNSGISHLNVYLVAGITSLLQFLFGTIAMILSLCYINFLSQDVTNNLQGLAEYISDAQITDENWKVITIQRINLFEGTVYILGQ
jgi:hypothetical protein